MILDIIWFWMKVAAVGALLSIVAGFIIALAKKDDE
jgi:hypothetical protein